MNEDKIVKGQAFLRDNQMIQTQTVFKEDGTVIDRDVVLIEDVWDDLLNAHTYKFKETGGNRKFFFWEYEMSELGNPDVTVKVYLECPIPTWKDDLSQGTGDWVEYWTEELKKIGERYKKSATIQPQTHYLAPSTYVHPGDYSVATETGTRLVTVNGVTVESPHEFGDIQNLLWMF